jgi:hypothetical protein
MIAGRAMTAKGFILPKRWGQGSGPPGDPVVRAGDCLLAHRLSRGARAVCGSARRPMGVNAVSVVFSSGSGMYAITSERRSRGSKAREFVGCIRCRAYHAGDRPGRIGSGRLDLFALSKPLRHASVAMTERYAHVGRGHLKAGVDRKALSRWGGCGGGPPDFG